MHAQDLLIDERSNGQTVEAVRHGLPQADTVASLTLIVEAVDAVDARRLMVAAQYVELVGVAHLERQQQADRLNGLLAAIDVIAEKQVVGGRRKASVLEQTQQVVVLAVDIACLSALVPQTRTGADTSTRHGWLMKISRAA